MCATCFSYTSLLCSFAAKTWKKYKQKIENKTKAGTKKKHVNSHDAEESCWKKNEKKIPHRMKNEFSSVVGTQAVNTRAFM